MGASICSRSTSPTSASSETPRARHDLEEQLRQAQKLGAVGKLAGGIAHDFNNRLVIIMGHGELLRRAVAADAPLAMHAEMILSSAKRAAELTRQLLAYSRRQVLKPETFDLSRLVERVHQLLASVLGDRIGLVTSLQATRLILADPGQIEQVILNLALNARDAMPEGGSLTLETKDVTLANGEHAALAGGDYVALVVRDTGSGIAGHVLPHIFEPFFTTKESGQGTGLGLSMVEGIVQQSGGATMVETRVGHGTTFTIYLPQGAAQIPETASPADTATPDSGTFETVLVCDDDDDVRKLVVDVLELRGYRLLQASGGRRAVEIASAHSGTIHLLVTDVAMPEMGGIELAAELRKQRPTLRVLYVSGYTENADLLSAPLGPDTHFLPKPFLPGDLTRTVTDILEHQPVASR
jgi:nitrogen-specific signal transduction histidine kinase